MSIGTGNAGCLVRDEEERRRRRKPVQAKTHPEDSGRTRCPTHAVSALLALDEVEDVLGIAPLGPPADLELEVDLRLEDLLDLPAGLDADLLDQGRRGR